MAPRCAYTRSVSSEALLAQHLEAPTGRGHLPADALTGAAGGAACGDLIRISLAIDPGDPDGRIADAGFDAHGCGAATAAGSAAVELLRGTPLLAAARIGADEIATELGGLSAAKRHAAELAADALHRALGMAARAQAHLAPAPGRAVVAMSGGVDSAVAALLTARGGGEVLGVTLELWADAENDGERSCCSAQAVRGAREAAHRMGLPHLSIDLREEFRAGVVDHWLAGHAAGETPNPCVRCNGEVRLEAMLELGRQLGSTTLVTGHYAQVQRMDREGNCSSPCDPRLTREQRGPGASDPELLLRMAVDPVKDQSYVLAGLAPSSLARLRFPLGEMHKTQVREIAQNAGLAMARTPDSQDLCFLAGTRLPRFLERHGELHATPGPIVDLAGNALGTHRGSRGYTVGQRHGLGLGGGDPLYVLGTDAAANTVTVGPRTALLTQSVGLRDVTLRRDGSSVDHVKVRSRGRRFTCHLGGMLSAGRYDSLDVELNEPIERTAAGQIACLYAGDVIVGYGTIAAAHPTGTIAADGPFDVIASQPGEAAGAAPLSADAAGGAAARASA